MTRFALCSIALAALVLAPAAYAAPSIVFLVDQAGGMESACGPTTSCRVAVRDALAATLPGFSDQADFGLALFRSDGGPGCPELTSVAPAAGTSAAIVGAINGAAFDGTEKPLADAITATVPLFAPSAGSRTIVAIFRGIPDTCAQPSPNQGEAAAIAAAGAVQAQGIEVVPINLLASTPTAFLQDLANAGAGLPIGGTQNASFYVALNPVEINAALNQAIEVSLAADVPIAGPIATGALIAGSVFAGWVGLRRSSSPRSMDR